MGSTESEGTSPQAEMNHSAKTAPDSGSVRPRSRWQVWAIALSAGLAAGLVAWLAGEPARNTFRPRLYRVISMGVTGDVPSRESQAEADTKNATVTFAIVGGAMGLAMGLAGGLVSRSLKRGAAVGLAALVAGAIVGVLLSHALIPLFFRRLVPDANDLMTPMLLQAGIWMAIGAVGGLAFGVGMRCGRQLPGTIVAACAGGMCAAVLYNLLSGWLFHDWNASDPVGNSAIAPPHGNAPGHGARRGRVGPGAPRPCSRAELLKRVASDREEPLGSGVASSLDRRCSRVALSDGRAREHRREHRYELFQVCGCDAAGGSMVADDPRQPVAELVECRQASRLIPDVAKLQGIVLQVVELFRAPDVEEVM